MATTYITQADLDFLLGGFVNRYYGTQLDGAEEITLGTQYYDDAHRSYDEANEWLSGITHIKQIPFGTQADGNYPLHVRKMQGNLMIYQRLLGAHYGEFSDDIPGWINVYKRRAEEVYSDIEKQNVVFWDEITQGEQGIGIGSWATKAGTVNLFTNWEIGFYTGDAYPKTYVVEIDGTTGGNVIGSATFKWSDNGGYTFATTSATTATNWIGLEAGLEIRWEPAFGYTGTLQLEYGDRFVINCVPQNVPVKGGGIRHAEFRRG